ncbi:MAG: MbtH domain protein [Bacteroidota bacterium]
MNELVKKLSEKDYSVVVNRPDRSSKALEERIRLRLVHVLFEETGTELGLRLDTSKCDYRQGDFANGNGKIHLQGVLTLNGERVRCVADVELDSMKGFGRLEPIAEEVYKTILTQQ